MRPGLPRRRRHWRISSVNRSPGAGLCISPTTRGGTPAGWTGGDWRSSRPRRRPRSRSWRMSRPTGSRSPTPTRSGSPARSPSRRPQSWPRSRSRWTSATRSSVTWPSRSRAIRGGGHSAQSHRGRYRRPAPVLRRDERPDAGLLRRPANRGHLDAAHPRCRGVRPRPPARLVATPDRLISPPPAAAALRLDEGAEALKSLPWRARRSVRAGRRDSRPRSHAAATDRTDGACVRFRGVFVPRGRAGGSAAR